MIFWILLLLGVSLSVVACIRNKQSDRRRYHRQRLWEKQEEMLESIRKKSAAAKDDADASNEPN